MKAFALHATRKKGIRLSVDHRALSPSFCSLFRCCYRCYASLNCLIISGGYPHESSNRDLRTGQKKGGDCRLPGSLLSSDVISVLPAPSSDDSFAAAYSFRQVPDDSLLSAGSAIPSGEPFFRQRLLAVPGRVVGPPMVSWKEREPQWGRIRGAGGTLLSGAGGTLLSNLLCHDKGPLAK